MEGNGNIWEMDVVLVEEEEGENFVSETLFSFYLLFLNFLADHRCVPAAQVTSTGIRAIFVRRSSTY